MSEYHVPTTRENRKETAILLVGTAAEYGLPQADIKPVYDGFLITEELMLVVYPDDEAEAPEEPAKKTSGNRAAKKNSEEE